jgi:hypothetical protein
MTGSGYSFEVFGSAHNSAHASAGNDRALHHDSADNDVFEAWADRSEMRGASYSSKAVGFDVATGYATRGLYASIIHDSS